MGHPSPIPSAPPCHICPPQYMDRTYVLQQQRLPVFALSLDLWRSHVVHSKKIAERLRAVLLDLVQREREGETIDRALFRSITQVGVCMRLCLCEEGARAWLSTGACTVELACPESQHVHCTQLGTRMCACMHSRTWAHAHTRAYTHTWTQPRMCHRHTLS